MKVAPREATPGGAARRGDSWGDQPELVSASTLPAAGVDQYHRQDDGELSKRSGAITSRPAAATPRCTVSRTAKPQGPFRNEETSRARGPPIAYPNDQLCTPAGR